MVDRMSDTQDRKRWHGLAHLVRDAVEHGSRAVEKVHLETARRPFVILEHIPAIAAPTKVIHTVHDLTVASVYETIRIVNRVVGTTVDVAFDTLGTTDEKKPE